MEKDKQGATPLLGKKKKEKSYSVVVSTRATKKRGNSQRCYARGAAKRADTPWRECTRAMRAHKTHIAMKGIKTPGTDYAFTQRQRRSQRKSCEVRINQKFVGSKTRPNPINLIGILSMCDTTSLALSIDNIPFYNSEKQQEVQ